MARPHIAGHCHRARDVDGRRSTEIQALVAHQVVDDRKRLGIGKAISGVDRRLGKIGGDPPLPDPFRDRRSFGLQLAMRVVVVERRAMRVGQRDADGLVECLEAQPYPGNRTTRTRRTGKTVDPVIELLPQLGRGAFDMRLAVGGVVELVGPDRAFGLFCKAARGVDEVARIGELGLLDCHQLCHQCAQRVHLLARLVVGHDDDGLVAERVSSLSAGHYGRLTMWAVSGRLQGRFARW